MRFAEKFWFDVLNGMIGRLIKRGSVTVIDFAGRRRTHGDGDAPRCAVRLHDPALARALFLNPELKTGEAYMDGTLTFDEGSVCELLAAFHLNAPNLRSRPFRQAMQDGVRRIRRFQQHNPATRAQANVAHHYDLSNDFYRLFLDDDLNYSCAYFEHAGQELEAAQRAKIRHIASKLRVERGMRVLDIGCGWGAMALYLAEHLGADVVGVTLSKEQRALAETRAKERGLASRVRFNLCDYRSVRGQFDRIVSIGMFEHVGFPQFERFFAQIHELLADDGIALLQAIGTKNGPAATGAWIRKYIFPGGYSPALSETFAAIERQQLWAADVEILRLHYAETLSEWSRRFAANRDKVRAMFDERFCRMWEFYLATSEFAFRYGGHMVFQIQLTKGVTAAPIRRNYVHETEHALRAKENACAITDERVANAGLRLVSGKSGPRGE